MPQTPRPAYMTDTQRFYYNIKTSMLEKPRETSSLHRIYLCFALMEVMRKDMGADEPLRGECREVLNKISDAFSKKTIEDYLTSECGVYLPHIPEYKQLIYTVRQSILTSIINEGAEACNPLKILKQTLEEHLPAPLKEKVVGAINAEYYWRGK